MKQTSTIVLFRFVITAHKSPAYKSTPMKAFKYTLITIGILGVTATLFNMIYDHSWQERFYLFSGLTFIVVGFFWEIIVRWYIRMTKNSGEKNK